MSNTNTDSRLRKYKAMDMNKHGGWRPGLRGQLWEILDKSCHLSEFPDPHLENCGVELGEVQIPVSVNTDRHQTSKIKNHVSGGKEGLSRVL